MKSDQLIDARGLACPMPIVRTKKIIAGMESGQVLEIHTTDKGSQSDMTAWCNSGGHELVQSTEEDGVYKFWIKKA